MVKSYALHASWRSSSFCGVRNSRLVSAEELSQPDLASNDESAPELNEDDEDDERSPASPSSSVEPLGSVVVGVGQMMELRSKK